MQDYAHAVASDAPSLPGAILGPLQELHSHPCTSPARLLKPPSCRIVSFFLQAFCIEIYADHYVS